MITEITQIDRDYGFDENDVVESQESFELAMKEIRNNEICERIDESFNEMLAQAIHNSKEDEKLKNRDILNKAARKLELLAQAIRDENKELFDDLTFDADDAYCLSVGIVANVNLDEVHSIIWGYE